MARNGIYLARAREQIAQQRAEMSASTAAAWTTPIAACPVCVHSTRRCSSR